MGFVPPASVVIFRNHETASITGTLVETTLRSFTLKAGLMGLNDSLRIEPIWQATNNANVKNLRVKIGASAVPMFSINSGYASLFRTLLWSNRNSLTSQVGYSAASSSGMGTSTSALFTSTEDTSTDLTISFTVELTNTGDTVSLQSVLVQHLRHI